MYLAHWVFNLINSSTIAAAKRLAARIDGIQAKKDNQFSRNQRKRLDEKVER
jgi:hypothetical protein